MSNAEVKGETPEKAEIVHRNDMINEILHIQSISRHLPTTAQELILQDANSNEHEDIDYIVILIWGTHDR
jgi:hypothetical protein